MSLDGGTTRKRRLNEIIKIVEKNEGIERDQVVGIIMLREGLTPQRIEIYIDELVKYGILIEKDHQLYPRYHQFED